MTTNGTLVIGDKQIRYSLTERRENRNTYMKFVGDELVVTAPSERLANKVMEKHMRWIYKHYSQIRNSVRLFDNNRILVLGNPHYVATKLSGRNGVEMGPNVITVSCRDPGSADRILKKWITEKTQKLAYPTAIEKAALLGKSIRVLRTRRSRKWGTCTRQRVITFNSFLAMLPPELMEYVICHEVSHLVELNHSRRFWNVVASICPNYKSLRKELHRYDNTGTNS